MDISEINIVMLSDDYDEKIELLSHLCDVFESYNKNINGLDEIVYTLINYAIDTSDDDLNIEILDAICKAQIHQDISKISFDRIAENVTKVSEKVLPRLIDVLSYTHNKKYEPIILQFKNHHNRNVRVAVDDAVIELGISH